MRNILRGGIVFSKISSSILCKNKQTVQQLLPKITSLNGQVTHVSRLSTARCMNINPNYESGGNVTVDEAEVERFRNLASNWWKSGGDFDALRSMNGLRLPFIRDALLENETPQNRNKPLQGYSILDVGSGGGILSEPLARLGGQVLGLDPVSENVEAAKLHAEQDPDLNDVLVYDCKTIEDHALDSKDTYDMVIASEVIEHIDRLDVFINSCCRLVKPGGHIFISTINRTLPALLFAKLAAEYVLNLVPPDTHTYEKFVTPEEVVDVLRIGNMVDISFKGMILNPLTNQWSWTSSTAMNYVCHARKPNV